MVSTLIIDIQLVINIGTNINLQLSVYHYVTETLRPETEDVFMDVDSEPETTQQIEDMEVTGWSEVKESESATEPLPKEVKDEITPDEIIHEAAVGKGLSGALKLLKERGTLNEGIDWGGRTMDKKKSKLVGVVEEPAPKEKEIRIERTDEFGRIVSYIYEFLFRKGIWYFYLFKK